MGKENEIKLLSMNNHKPLSKDMILGALLKHYNIDPKVLINRKKEYLKMAANFTKKMKAVIKGRKPEDIIFAEEWDEIINLQLEFIKKSQKFGYVELTEIEYIGFLSYLNFKMVGYKGASITAPTAPKNPDEWKVNQPSQQEYVECFEAYKKEKLRGYEGSVKRGCIEAYKHGGVLEEGAYIASYMSSTFKIPLEKLSRPFIGVDLDPVIYKYLIRYLINQGMPKLEDGADKVMKWLSKADLSNRKIIEGICEEIVNELKGSFKKSKVLGCLNSIDTLFTVVSTLSFGEADKIPYYKALSWVAAQLPYLYEGYSHNDEYKRFQTKYFNPFLYNTKEQRDLRKKQNKKKEYEEQNHKSSELPEKFKYNAPSGLRDTKGMGGVGQNKQRKLPCNFSTGFEFDRNLFMSADEASIEFNSASGYLVNSQQQSVNSFKDNSQCLHKFDDEMDDKIKSQFNVNLALDKFSLSVGDARNSLITLNSNNDGFLKETAILDGAVKRMGKRDDLDTLINSLEKCTSTWSKSFKDIGGSVGKTMSGVFDKITKGIESTKKVVGKIQKGLGFINKIDGVLGSKGIFSGISKTLGGLLKKDGPLGKVFGSVGGFMGKLGGIGAGIGSAVSAISGAFKGLKGLFGGKSTMDRIKDSTRGFADDLGANLGGVRKQMKAYADSMSGSHKAQRAFNAGLGDMIRQADISKKGFSRYAGKVKDVFKEYDLGNQSMKETKKYIGSGFAALAEKQSQLGGHYSAEMKEIIHQANSRGIEVKEVTDYINKRQADGLKAYKELTAQLEAGPLNDEAELIKARMDKMQEGSAEYRAAAENLSEAQVRARDANAAMEVFGDVGIELFEEMIAKEERLAQNSEIINKYKGFETAVLALTDTTDISQEKFTDIGSVLGNAYAKMTEGGMTSKDALQEMAPSLARMIELANAHGYTIDENTQKMIDQAQKEGVNLTKQLKPKEKMVGLFESIAKKMGLEIPYAMGEMGGSLENSVNKIKGGAENQVSTVVSEEVIPGIEKYRARCEQVADEMRDVREKIDETFSSADKAKIKADEEAFKHEEMLRDTAIETDQKLSDAIDKSKNEMSLFHNDAELSLTDITTSTDNYSLETVINTDGSSNVVHGSLISLMDNGKNETGLLKDNTDRVYADLGGNSTLIKETMSEKRAFKSLQDISYDELNEVSNVTDSLKTEVTGVIEKEFNMDVGTSVDDLNLNKHAESGYKNSGSVPEDERRYANGTNGWINSPARFLVGEGGEPELLETMGNKIRVTPASRIPVISTNGLGRGEDGSHIIRIAGTASREDKADFVEIMRSVVRDTYGALAGRVEARVS